MNLADAIRQVHVLPDSPNAITPDVTKTIEEDAATSPSAAAQSKFENPRSRVDSPPQAMLHEDVTPVSVSGNAIRLELFLNAEQMNSMLRAIMSGHHSVMTPAEAARYLRIPVSQLEKMAEDSSVPALKIEGRWRFPKAALDEWLTLRSFKSDQDFASTTSDLEEKSSEIENREAA